MAANCLPVYPTITPPNWASIATGAWPGTHGITDFWVPMTGVTPDNSGTVEAFSSQRWQAEPIWDALDRAGKTCIVINYPGAWPSRMKNGIMVGGAGTDHRRVPRRLAGTGIPASAVQRTAYNYRRLSQGNPGEVRAGRRAGRAWKVTSLTCSR